MFEPGIYNFKMLEEGVETSRGQVEVLKVRMPHLECRFGGVNTVIINSASLVFISAVRVGDLETVEDDDDYEEGMPVIMD
jgi:hypothetical protein